MKLHFGLRYLAIFVLFLASITGLFAQISGDIEIKAVDPSGASVGDAKVTARNLETGTTRTATTAGDGSVRIALLNVGKYEVKVESAGFAPFTQQVDVNSGRVSDLRAALELQTTRQEVVVSEQAEVLNTSNAQLQNVATTRDIVELPVNTNTAGILTFAATAPGVVPMTPNNNNGFLGFGNFSSNGGRTRGANITVDNATATDVSTTGATGLAQPLVGHFGTLGRNVLRINGLNNFDWTLGKKFPIRERMHLELQAQAFNVFNHTSFALLSANTRNIATPTVFGYYDGTQSESRNIQLNLRLIW